MDITAQPQAVLAPERPHRVVMLGFDGAQVLDVAGPLEVFARTARWLQDHWGFGAPAYEIELVAHDAGAIETSGGLRLLASRSYLEAGAADTLLIGGGIGYAALLDDAALLDWLRDRATGVSRLGSICTGAMVLGAAGLLDGRRATTHWAYCERLAALAPGCRVDPDAIYVRDGNIFTSAGVTTGMDLALAFVEADWGRSVALAVAQELVLYLKRPGGQSQFSRLLQAQRRDDRFGDLERWMIDNLAGDLSVPVLAAQAGMSVRHFVRRFTEEMRMPPSRFVVQLRVEHARRRISDGARNLKAIARETGFGDEQRLRRAFQRLLGIAPATYRERFS